METQSGVEMFLRSIKTRNLRYTVYVGDGDSSCYAKVHDACFDKYGASYAALKEECVGHIQKRMGSDLREYKRKNKGRKLNDGKPVGVIGRLTDAFIDRIHNNYGEAIRNNSDVPSMKNAIMAIYHHMIKDDNLSLVQQHKYYPKTPSTRCKYSLDKLYDNGTYSENCRLPTVFKPELKHLFERLSDEERLKRCIQSLTQNQNESVNNILWTLCTKRTFCDAKTHVLQNCSCDPKVKMLTSLRKENEQRITHAEIKNKN